MTDRATTPITVNPQSVLDSPYCSPWLKSQVKYLSDLNPDVLRRELPLLLEMVMAAKHYDADKA